MHAVAERPRIACLDGLRALSIALVLAGHSLRVACPGPSHSFGQRAIEAGAQLGVQIFFCISGFLITTLLARGQDDTGHLDLKGFYWRRAVRILPPLYAYLLLMKLASLVGLVRLENRDFLSAFFFLRDYLQRPEGWVVSHTWSLGVEEKFYLLYPLLLACGRRTALRVTLLLIPLVAWGRYWSYFHWPECRAQVGFQFHILADLILWGCAAALWVRRGLPQRARQACASPLLQWGVGVLLLVCPCLTSWWGTELYYFTLGLSWNGFLIAVLVVSTSQCSTTSLAKLLQLRPLVYVGVLSYSLYIWQEPFMDGASWSHGFPLNLLAAWVCAELSYRLVERPSLNWRSRRERGPLRAVR